MDNFNNDRLNEFWKFLVERQNIYYKSKVLREPFPWTDDKVLQTFSFTNIYRILDPGTRYIFDAILDTDFSFEDKFWNIAIYRLIGRQRTHEMSGFMQVSLYDSVVYENFLRYLRYDLDIAPFSIAYLTPGLAFVNTGDSDKIKKVPKLFAQWKSEWNIFCNNVLSAKSPEEAYKAILEIPGIGNFLAFQIYVDMTYKNKNEERLLDLPEEEIFDWAKAGPGALAGLSILSGGDRRGGGAYTRNSEGLISWLHKKSTVELHNRGFKFLHDNAGNIIELSAADIQNCLCEVSKHWKITNGDGKARRKFVAPNLRTIADLKDEEALNG